MADKLMRAQVTIPLIGGLPEDYPTNTFYFDGDDGLTDAQYHGAVVDLLRFQHAAQHAGLGYRLGRCLGELVARAGVDIVVFGGGLTNLQMKN